MENNMNDEGTAWEESAVQVEEVTEEIREAETVIPPPEEKKEKVKESRELTPAEIQRRKKMLVFPLMFLVFAGAMWLIFAPSSKEKEKEIQKGFNIDVPLPNEKGLLDDKKEAYEQEAFEKQRKEKMGTLQDFDITIGRQEDIPIGTPANEMAEENVSRTSVRPSVLLRLPIRT